MRDLAVRRSAPAEPGRPWLLGLFAYGRVSQYLNLLASAEEHEARKQLGPRFYRTGRQGPNLFQLMHMADERRSTLANLLPPETSPRDLVLASSVALHDEVKLEVDRADVWGHYDDPDLGLSVRRVMGSITGVLVDGFGDEGRFRRADQEMLVAAAQAGAMLVTQSESLASRGKLGSWRVDTGEQTPAKSASGLHHRGMPGGDIVHIGDRQHAV